MATRKKLNTEILKMSDKDVGFSVSGKFLGYTERLWVDPASGEEKPLKSVILQKIVSSEVTDERIAIFMDKGMENALTNSLVKEGDAIEIVKLEQVDLPGGRRVNQYDIFGLSL